MNSQDWFLSTLSTSAVTTLLVAGLAWLLRNLITNRLKASVQHEFDEKLETLRTDLRKSEEAFKADLRAKEAQIATLQSGALTVLASRQAALDKRRLEAIEQLWEGVEILGPMKWAVGIMRTIDFEGSLEATSQDPNARRMFSTLGQGYSLDKLKKPDAHKARPFVSEIAWALFSAYQAILIYAVLQLQMLKEGVNKPNYLKSDRVPNLVKAALPNHASYIDEQGLHGCYLLLDELEAKLLKELQGMMQGEESDMASVKQAAKIMDEVKKVNEATKGNELPPMSSPISQ